MNAISILNEQMSITGALGIRDIDGLKAKGFTAIICNRPDYEDGGQSLAAEMESRATELGMRFLHIPVTQTGPTMQDIQMTKEALDSAEGPILAYCKSGMRSAMLWSLASAVSGGVTSDQLLSTVASAGFDLSGLRPALDNMIPS